PAGERLTVGMQSDRVFKVAWPASTTPQAPDGSGTSPVSLCGYSLTNVAVSPRYLKVYDKSSAPVVGTDSPKLTIDVPASGSRQSAPLFRAARFQFGLWISVSVNPLDSDNTAPSAADVLVTVLWTP